VGVSCLNGSKGWFRTCLEILEQPVFSLTAEGTNCCFDLSMGWVGKDSTQPRSQGLSSYRPWVRGWIPFGVNEMIEEII